MNCFQARRALLEDPRRRTGALEEHLGGCAPCSALATDLMTLEDQISDAAAVPVPDALADRILLAREHRPRLQHAAAAAVLMAVALAAAGVGTELADSDTTVDVVGPGHPAVAAISEVAHDAPRALLSEQEASRELEQVLGRVGLTLKKGEATAQYVGKCHVTGTACDRIVLTTHDAQANVILVPEYPLGRPLLVSDGRMSALASSARTGGYIVVSDTPRNARRMARLLTKG